MLGKNLLEKLPTPETILVWDRKLKPENLQNPYNPEIS